ncbi:MAG: hypothetical protein JNM24_00365 [Bdellovibrionaceae bacterium]|nr:hypothetical protein [Pseudobdellovibrionaceae bacterium]
MTIIKDMTEQRYKEITESSFTPFKLRQDWTQKIKDGKSTVQLFITKNFDLNINEYHLLVGIAKDTNYLIFNYLCEQPPTFVVSDICHIIVNNIQNHGNNTYLVNQYLNASGYKNIEHIVMDIFTQEMGNKIGQNYLTDTAILFNDYSYLIQKALTDIQFTLNSIDLKDEKEQTFFFFMLSVEESIKKLNQEFMFLYFCFYKMSDETRVNKIHWAPTLSGLRRGYFQRIDHHINALKVSLANQKEMDTSSDVVDSVSIQLEHLLKNLELFQKKEAYLGLSFLPTKSSLEAGE